MHGVKRLFSWMIPRFDRQRYNVSLVSLRKKDLSEETLESLGIDITYLGKSRFDPTTLPALMKVIRQKKIDILHLHGYGATTFGRIVAGMRRIPTILHEHANLTDTPWFQKVADAVLEPETDIALAVSQSTAEFVIKARQLPPDKVKVVYLGVPLEEFSRNRSAEDIASARAELGVQPGELLIGSVTRLHDSKGNEYLVDAAKLVLDERPQARFVVFFCFDTMEEGGKGPVRYYESIDLIDARHPQTILAYEMNGETLPIAHGAPLRVRIERQLGYKMAKFIRRIELVEDFSGIGGGKGGYWEDRGYDWFAGI